MSLRASSPIWASETSLARTRFACPNRRACSQAIDKYDYGLYERKGCVQQNLYFNCVSRSRMVRCQVIVTGGDIGQSASGVHDILFH